MFRRLRNFLGRIHWPILLVMLTLMVAGVAAIDVTERAEGAAASFSRKQAVFACLGVAVFLAVSGIPYQRVGRLAYLLFAATLLLLVILLVPPLTGARTLLEPILPTIRGSNRWIDLTGGAQKVLLQPSELAKLTYVILLAWYLRYRQNYRRLRGLAVPFALTLVPMGLILAEPDLGTSLLLPPTLFLMLFLAGARKRHLLGVMALTMLMLLLPVPQRVPPPPPGVEAEAPGMAYGWGGKVWSFRLGQERYVLRPAPFSIMKEHQLRRIEGWWRQNDPNIVRGKGYQLYQSKMLLATGRWFGRGGWGDAEAYFHLLPDDHTDFIFSVIGGQWGLAGCLVLLALYGALLAVGLRIAVSTDEPFGRLLAVGILALLFSQVCINVGMAMGLMPITGMTLPLISYGGSSLLVNCAALGLLASVGRHRPILLAKRPFEYGERRQRPSPLAQRQVMAPAGGAPRGGQASGSSRSTASTETPAPCRSEPAPN